MKRTVIVQPQADHEFEVLYGYIQKRSPEGANRWANAFFALLKELQTSADSFGLAPESSRHSEDIYHVTFKTRRGLLYRVLYLIRGEEVRVIHLRGPGQDEMHQADIVLP